MDLVHKHRYLPDSLAQRLAVLRNMVCIVAHMQSQIEGIERVIRDAP